MLEFAINDSFQESIQDTPFFQYYGRHPRVPSDIRLPEENPTAHKYLDNIDQAMQQARQRMQAAQQRQKRYADEHRSDLSFKVNDKAHIPLRAVDTKNPLMLDPFTVVRVAYQAKLPDGWRTHGISHVSVYGSVFHRC